MGQVTVLTDSAAEQRDVGADEVEELFYALPRQDVLVRTFIGGPRKKCL